MGNLTLFFFIIYMSSVRNLESAFYSRSPPYGLCELNSKASFSLVFDRWADGSELIFCYELLLLKQLFILFEFICYSLVFLL